MNKINKNKLDPLELYDNIAQILCREEKQVPPKEEESDEDYRQKLIEVFIFPPNSFNPLSLSLSPIVYKARTPTAQGES